MPSQRTRLPTYDDPRFGSWLARWKATEGLQWTEIARRSGIHTSMVHKLQRGVQDKGRPGAGNKINPSAESLARLAYGLEIEFPYLLTKTGLLDFGREGSRWGSFSTPEREHLLAALRA